MKLEITHEVLVVGPDFARSRDYVLRFFAKTPLVRYDTVTVDEAASCPASHPDFWPRVDLGVRRNQEVLAELIGELKESGLRGLDDLRTLPKGYQSKLVHTVAHLVDGFFGIDTVFYNMADDSHGVSPQLRHEIQANPTEYWLLMINAELKSREREGLVASLRRFETGS
ncbi:MAG TPA: hypothetical protein VLL73_04530 [Desulfurivibrionaceae bacterium]|nr:hypothetical protein [Desulfurivibrionaceae bacterium]